MTRIEWLLWLMIVQQFAFHAETEFEIIICGLVALCAFIGYAVNVRWKTPEKKPEIQTLPKCARCFKTLDKGVMFLEDVGLICGDCAIAWEKGYEKHPL